MSAVTNGKSKNEEKGMIVRRIHGLHETQRDTEVLKVVLYLLYLEVNRFYLFLFFIIFFVLQVGNF